MNLLISCTIGHRGPLTDVEEEIDGGELVAVVGGNGAGKSTLLSTVAGELRPVEGTVTVDGKDPADGDAAVVRIAEPEFYPDVTVGEHIDLLARRPGVDRERAVREWQLEDLLEAFPGMLSSGQRQRVFLGAQLARDARVLVLDEPERHLDAGWVQHLIAVLRERARAGAAVLVATHSRAVVDACDRRIRL